MNIGRSIDWRNPTQVILLVVGVLLAVELITDAFPRIMDGFVTLSGIGNFTFGSFFESAGLMALVLSAIILLGILAMLGLKTRR